MSSLVSVTIENGVATIAMDDGKANVLSHAMWDELEAAFDQAEEAGGHRRVARPGRYFFWWL